MHIFYLFFSLCFVFYISCNTNKLVANPREDDYKAILLEMDYNVFEDKEKYLKIKILNENILEKLQKIIKPVILINKNGDVKIAKGMTVIDSKIPLPCDYTFQIDIKKNTVIFEEEDILIFTPIENYEYSPESISK
jgi:hypothetical protein